MRWFALLFIIIACAEFANEVNSFDIFGLSLNSCTLQVIPTRAPTFSLVTTLHPIALLNDLPANAFLLLLIVIVASLCLFFDSLLSFSRSLHFLLLSLVLTLVFLGLVDVLFFQVVQDNSLKIKRVEKGSLSERCNVVRIDGSYLKGVFAHLDYLVVFGDICDFVMGCTDRLQKLILIGHSLNTVFDHLKIVLVLRIWADEFDGLVSLG